MIGIGNTRPQTRFCPRGQENGIKDIFETTSKSWTNCRLHKSVNIKFPEVGNCTVAMKVNVPILG